MHVFVTGATGWVGSAVTMELLKAGHQVTGLVRADHGTAALAGIGAQALRASRDDLDVLRQAAARADAVIHTAFNHDFSRFAENAEQDRRAIEALERGATEPIYHAIADEAVPFKAIAEAIGRRLGLPVESREREHFGWFAMMAGADLAASSARTRELLDWQPQGPTLMADLDPAGYYGVE